MRTWNPEAVRLAQVSRDDTANCKDRLCAMILLDLMMRDGSIFVEVPGNINDMIDRQTVAREAKKEEYVWRKGARVKVRK